MKGARASSSAPLLVRLPPRRILERPASALELSRFAHDSPLGTWELLRCKPAPPLGDYVDHIWGSQGAATFNRERIFPTGRVDVLFNLGPVQTLIHGDEASLVTEYQQSFVSGLQQRSLLIESPAWSRMMCVTFRPLGAHAFFGVPMSELANHVHELDLVLGAWVREVRERLLEEETWEARFHILANLVEARLADGPAIDSEVAYAFAELTGDGDGVRIRDLADEIGISQKHLIHKFKRYLGLSPKQIAKIARFQRVIARVYTAGTVDWTEIAHGAGYYDQAHFIHDFRGFTGVTPGHFLRELSPDGTSVMVR